MPNLVEVIKKAALDAVAASNPMSMLYGTVTSVDPIQINVEQRMTLGAEQLVLSSLVSDFEVDMTFDHQTEDTAGGSGDSAFESHHHAVTGKKSTMVHLGLSVGESVVLLRAQGGQKFLVLDRVR